MKELTLEIQGMSCAHCLASVRKALASVPGVTVRDVAIGSATLDLDPTVADIGTVIDAVQDAGYEASEVA